MDLDRELESLKDRMEDLLTYFELTERLLDQAIQMSNKVGHHKMEAMFQVMRKVLPDPEATSRLFIVITDFVASELADMSDHDKSRMKDAILSTTKEKASEKFGYEISEEELQAVKKDMIETLSKL